MEAGHLDLNEIEHGPSDERLTSERACAPLRRELAAEALATVRFETGPGRQLQIDFGTRRIAIRGEAVPVALFVATSGYSRRRYVRAFGQERQSAWVSRAWKGRFATSRAFPRKAR